MTKPSLLHNAHKFPTISLVGRPNVGKSTLFNRLVGRKSAIVHDQAGVTRDRKDGVANIFGKQYRITDTPGLYDPNDDSVQRFLSSGMRNQAISALNDSDLIIFIVDGRVGCTPYDKDLANELRRLNKPIVIAVNKCEGNHGFEGLGDAAALNLSDEIIPISAEHGEGIHDLSAAIGKYTNHIQVDIEANSENLSLPNRPIQLIIMGRPNVGKSTLINALLGENRQLTGDMPGLTRDSVAVPFAYNNQDFTLFDTAGIRKQARVKQSLEQLSVMDARKALQFGEVVVLVVDGSVDAMNPLEKQDLHLAEMVVNEGRAFIIAINKSDLIKDIAGYRKRLQNQLSYNLPQAAEMPIVEISALKQKNVFSLLDRVMDIYTLWNKRLSTGELNRWFDYTTLHHAPPAVGGRRIRLKYITQIKSRPPTFSVFGTKSKDVPDSYKRYLINRLREDFKMPGVPIRLFFRSPENPYAHKKKK